MATLTSLGGCCQKEGSSFKVWAPNISQIDVHVTVPAERQFLLQKSADGYHEGFAEGLLPGSRYYYRLDGKVDRPDPASRFQPEGVHGPSELVDSAFEWTDQAWFGIPLRDYLIYELHVGAFTSAGTFDAIISHLADLKELGVTAIELMPVAQFPGSRNWGYDGVLPFAVQNSYGGPLGLKRLVNECHRTGLAVILDVVYNHFGPEGNYLAEFGPYFNDSYKTAWGAAINFDGPYSDHVRQFFLENALGWQTEFHIDALRLDAVHAIRDFSARPFLQQLAQATRKRSEELNRRFYLIAESDLNDSRLITPSSLGGHGLDAQWSDDFHHCLHALLTGEKGGYYEDYDSIQLLAKVFRQGYAYSGQYSRHRKRAHGNSPALNSARQFVVFAQNHDQIGNRLRGDRLSRNVSFEKLKLGAATVLLSPFIPLLFMGEEFGDTGDFQYFIDHGDAALVDAVRKGRSEEFAAFGWTEAIPDPKAEATFAACRLNRSLLRQAPNKMLYKFYRELIRIRKTSPALREADKETMEVQCLEGALILLVQYRGEHQTLQCCFNYSEKPVAIPSGGASRGPWTKVLDSAAGPWAPGASKVPDKIDMSAEIVLSPLSAVVLQAAG